MKHTIAKATRIGLLLAASPLFAVQPNDLRCEYLKNPIGVDVVKPRLNWRIETGQRGWQQQAYQILAASSTELLKQDQGDLWDSGKVDSDRSTQVEYHGKPLEHRMRCFWKVRVWDKDGKPGDWSEPGLWSMGPREPKGWTGKWITMNVNEGLAHPWFRRTFDLASAVSRAEIYINTPSHYELYINGQKVGHEVLVPAHHQHRKRMLYNAYEVSSYLKKGRNCLALWMGPGWYQPRYGNPYKAPIVRVQADIYTPDGLVTLTSDSQWRVHDSCISQIGGWGWSDMGGERWDDGKYPKDWNQAAFDDGPWAAALEIPPPGIQRRPLPGEAPVPRVTASSSTPDYPPSLAVDGSDETRWVSNGSKPGMGPSDEKPEYLQFDYDKEQSFEALYLKPHPVYDPPKEIIIQCSDDGKAYRELRRATLARGQETSLTFCRVQSAHFRVVFLSSYAYPPESKEKSSNVQVSEVAFLTGGTRVAQSWQGMPGSRLGEPIKPVKICARNDKWMIDFGATLTGWMRLRMTGLKPGQEVRIDYSDLDDARLMHKKNADGIQNFGQVDLYVAGNETEGVFQSKFNQHAFRYVFISGLSKAPALDDAVAMSVYSDLEPAGSFRCSNELFNRIHQVTVNTSYSQNPCGALGGGEAREKLGYGDGGSFLTGFLYHMRSDAFYTKWLRDWRDNQQPDGFLGHTAPEYYRAGGGPSWGGEASELVRRLYVYYGDRRAIADAYPVLKKYLAHLESNTKGDILRYFDPYHRDKKSPWAFLGDWTPPGPGPDKHGFVFETELQQEFFNNCYRILLWEQLAAFAEALGDPAEATRCRQRLEVLRPLIHKTYWDPEKGTYQVTRQTYLTVALLARIMPPELRPAIFKQLEDDIVIAKQGHLDTGLQGSSMLLELLTQENRNDLVALMMNQTTFPGWGFLVKERNVTTWPETWSGWGSQVIHVVGTCGAWFFEGLAGIRPDPAQPGFKHFVVRPGVVKSVDWVECSYMSPYGTIVSNWKVEGDRLQMEVAVPPNTTATVYVPTANPKAVTESGGPADKAAGATRQADADNAAVFELASGNHRLEAPFKKSSL